MICGKPPAEGSSPDAGFDLIAFPHVLENHARPEEAFRRAIGALDSSQRVRSLSRAESFSGYVYLCVAGEVQPGAFSGIERR